MIIFYILLAVLVVSRMRFITKGFHTDYLSFDTTNAIKGIFILLVFIKHATPYITESGYIYDGWDGRLFSYIDAHVGQWIVAMFLFYSGYGIMESIIKKGQPYISSMPKKRLLTVLVNFDIAVLCFIVVVLILGKHYPIKDYLLSFIGWESVGNSNWYIFVIMLCYLITYLSFRKQASTYHQGAFRCCIFLFIAVIVLSFFKPDYWYNTMLCFGAGILYSTFKQSIEAIIKKHYWITLGILFILLGITANIPLHAKGLVYNAFSIVFCLLIIVLSMRIRINNKALIWCGKNLFPLYIYQRIPMILLSTVGGGIFVCNYPVLYTTLCLAITLLITYLYKYWAIKL